MRSADNKRPDQWWPVSPHGNAPEVFLWALASLSPDPPSAIYCWSMRSDQEEDVFDWHVLAVSGQSLVELHGAGPEGSAEESGRKRGQRVPVAALSVARCHRLRDAVAGVRVLDMQRTARGYQLAATDPWDVTWLLEMTSGEPITLPEPDAQSDSHIADAERLVTAVLQHLQAS